MTFPVEHSVSSQSLLTVHCSDVTEIGFTQKTYVLYMCTACSSCCALLMFGANQNYNIRLSRNCFVLDQCCSLAGRLLKSEVSACVFIFFRYDSAKKDTLTERE